MDTTLHPLDSNVEDILHEDSAKAGIDWFESDSDDDPDISYPSLESYSDTEDEEYCDEYGFSYSPTRHEVNEGEP